MFAYVQTKICLCLKKNPLLRRNLFHYISFIEFAPTFTNFGVQENMMATVKANFTIYCQPEAAPEPVITWYKDGSNLNPGTNPGEEDLRHYKRLRIIQYLASVQKIQ